VTVRSPIRRRCRRSCLHDAPRADAHRQGRCPRVLQGASDADADSLTAGGGGYGPLLAVPPSTATVRSLHRLASGYTGTDSFLYAVTDGVVTTSATVSIQVLDEPPVVTNHTYASRKIRP